MDAEGSAAAFGEDLEVAACLGGDDLAEGEAAVGDRQVGVRLVGELQEEAGRRAALVGLTGGVQEPWPEAESGRCRRGSGPR